MTKTASRMPGRNGLCLLLLALAVAFLAVAATGMGFIPVSPAEVLGALADWARGADVSGLHASVVLDVRLPRILTALSVGFGLAVAGTVFQSILLNPLADPFTLGVSSGAAFGASLSILLGLSFLGPSTLCVMAFAGASATLFLVLAMAGRDSALSPSSLILAGVIVAAILSAGISFIKYLADERVSAIVFWLMGSFTARTWTDAALTGLVGLAGFLICLLLARDLNIMSLGERTARSLGVNTARTRLVLLATASLISAVCVSVSGIIGFVGLIMPHLMRLITGPDNRWLLPASGLGGAALLLVADTVSRAMLPHEVPIGVLTALIGGPVFCWLFIRSRTRRHHA
ncbi:FecCD family ABC transporter permease [Pseudodesulfovibrio tunisiensis]|uniref:FecCD family ABC transporter permease n=1 Tax=Pseudodesulfovibrio tunisiensis TaxID=463192 RepID=UPI001FB2E537|nr:iron ABC transporter permease [Pseudodesulfovibrio tunisiensis]